MSPPKTTKQGVRDLNGPRNGKRETPKGDPQPKPTFHGVCEHSWRLEFDEFGGPAGYSCVRCGEWETGR